MTRDDVSREARIWRAVIQRVRWMTFFLAILANAVVFMFGIGYYARDYEARLESVEKIASDTASSLSALQAETRSRLVGVEARQNTADQLAIRLEERLDAIQRGQSDIKRLVEAMAEEARRR